MKKIKIAIQGELGAYSHIAANNLFKDAEIKTCSTFEDTFKQAYNDSTYKIIIPIVAITIPEAPNLFNFSSRIKNSKIATCITSVLLSDVPTIKFENLNKYKSINVKIIWDKEPKIR